MAKDVLLEVGLEEIPAKYVRSSSEQLKKLVEQFLTDNRLTYQEAFAYATPRRLAVIVKQVAEKQEDSVEIAKGPAQHIAQDENGKWTKAALGFVQGQGMTPDAIFWKEIKGVPYAHVEKQLKGETAQTLLKGLKDVVLSMTFPVSMTWGNHTLKYIRPIHWLIALYGEEIIPFDILNVSTNIHTRGHRFLGKATTVERAQDYVNNLAKEYVLVDQDERKQRIVDQIAALASANDWTVALDEDLLEEVTSIVEYPTAFYGAFDEKYLAVPDEVLVTTMKEHQRYFYVKDKMNHLLPFFIAVRNGNEEHLEQVIKGNEKVLVARLEDALFFTKEDEKIELEQAVEKLKTVNFHVKIGSMYEKMTRTRAILDVLSEFLQVDVSDAKRAGELYKFDLVTNMVGEFPELQGIMGEKYALAKGENPHVSQAIREHYLPLSTHGELPESQAGALLAVADKLDTLISFFLQNMVPSGSNDPYALRRQAMGIVSIFEKENWQIDVLALLKHLLQQVYNTTSEEVLNALQTFIQARLQQKLQAYTIRHDIIESVLAISTLNVPLIIAHAKDLQENCEQSTFKQTIESVSRVLNLAKKADNLNVSYQDSLGQTDSEKVLYQAFSHLLEPIRYDNLVTLIKPITDFFDNNMVLVDDEAVRFNRLALLKTGADKLLMYADTTKLVVK